MNHPEVFNTIIVLLFIVTEASSTIITQFTTNPGYDDYPAWSPDGQTIVYSSSPNVILDYWWQDPTIEIWTKPVAGGDPTRLTYDNVVSEYPNYSPDGSKILFVTMANPNWLQKGIFTIPASGGPKSVVYDSYANDYAASWSPDGTKIVFISEMGGGYGGQRVWTVSSDGSGGNLTQITFGTPGDWVPVWSPDGSMIAFYSDYRTGTPTVWVVPASGGAPISFVTSAGMPRYSPDGKWLSFLSIRDGKIGIWAMSLDGGEETMLFTIDHGGIGFYNWSPNSKKIAFSWNYDIYIASDLPINPTNEPVPEPSTILLLTTGLGSMVAIGIRRRLKAR